MNRTFEIPLSFLYATGIRLWRMLYERKIIPRNRSPVPTIGIGNITTGGSGKTPLVIALANLYATRGRNVGILSRGYGGKSFRDPMVFRAEDDVDPEIVGDEPALMAKKLPDCSFAVSSDRYRGVLELAASGVDLVVLDDGFQSLELIQDRQLVFFPEEWILDPGSVRKDYKALVPYGSLRDFPWTLKDADVILYNVYGETGSEEDNGENTREASIRRVLESLDPVLGKKPVLGQRISFSGIVDRDFRPAEKIDAIRSKKVGLVSGIGRPERFHRTAERLGIDPVDILVLPDHVRYDAPTLASIGAWVGRANEKSGIDMILTTEKDLVKWRKAVWEGVEIRALSIRSEPIDPERWISSLGEGVKHER